MKAFIQRNKETAIGRYGHLLDENRNIIGTNHYFDEFWRLRKRNNDLAEEAV